MIIAYKILIGLAGLFGLYQLFRMTNTFARVIVAGQIIAICLTFIPYDTSRIIGFGLVLLLALVAVIYGFSEKKSLTLVITIPVFLALLFESNSWPFAGLIAWTMTIPIIAYVAILRSNLKQYKNELGFLTILMADAIIRLSEQISWIMFN